MKQFIGIQYEAWNGMESELSQEREKVTYLQYMYDKLRTEFEEMTSWKHIKIAFLKTMVGQWITAKRIAPGYDNEADWL